MLLFTRRWFVSLTSRCSLGKITPKEVIPWEFLDDSGGVFSTEYSPFLKQKLFLKFGNYKAVLRERRGAIIRIQAICAVWETYQFK